MYKTVGLLLKLCHNQYMSNWTLDTRHEKYFSARYYSENICGWSTRLLVSVMVLKRFFFTCIQGIFTHLGSKHCLPPVVFCFHRDSKARLYFPISVICLPAIFPPFFPITAYNASGVKNKPALFAIMLASMHHTFPMSQMALQLQRILQPY